MHGIPYQHDGSWGIKWQWAGSRRREKYGPIKYVKEWDRSTSPWARMRAGQFFEWVLPILGASLVTILCTSWDVLGLKVSASKNVRSARFFSQTEHSCLLTLTKIRMVQMNPCQNRVWKWRCNRTLFISHVQRDGECMYDIWNLGVWLPILQWNTRGSWWRWLRSIARQSTRALLVVGLLWSTSV